MQLTNRYCWFIGRWITLLLVGQFVLCFWQHEPFKNKTRQFGHPTLAPYLANLHLLNNTVALGSSKFSETLIASWKIWVHKELKKSTSITVNSLMWSSIDMNWDFGTLQQPSTSSERTAKHGGISPLEFMTIENFSQTALLVRGQRPRICWHTRRITKGNFGNNLEMELVVEGAGDNWAKVI